MTNLLSLESSGTSCSVALKIADSIEQRHYEVDRQHAQLLLPAVDELLQAQKLTLADLDAIAFGCGPGSFTGIRICASIAQGLAYGANLPLIPISTLSAVAAVAIEQCSLDDGQPVAVAVDARMREVYFANFTVVDQAPQLIGEESVLPANQTLASHLHDASSIGAGSGWQLDGVAGLLAKTYAHVQPNARALALLAEREFSRGEVSANALIEPTYLRNEVTWKKHTPIRNR